MSSGFTPVYFSKSPSVIGLLILFVIVAVSSIYLGRESFSFVLGELNKVIIYMVHWSLSYKYGKAQEVRIHPIIKTFFNTDIQHTINQYDKYDFYDDKTNYEVKSRTNKYDKYPTTMITMNKCCKCDKGKDLILLFNFTDALYYIKFEEEKFRGYQKQLFSRLQEEWDEKEHIYIPITDLTLITKWDNPIVGGF